MDNPEEIEKSDWNTILSELDGIIRETNHLALMAIGDKNAYESGEELPALIHFINEIKKEKKSQSWEKINEFINKVKENLKFLEETQQIKMQNRRIDRTIIGVLPKNTTQLGKNTIQILNEIPGILNIINESVEALLIDIKLKLGFPIVKFEKEILDIKHQIGLIDEEIKAHTKSKKGLISRDEQIVYTQAFQEKYHEILDKAKSYISKDMKIHSKAFEDIFERYTEKIKNYRANPAFDDFVKENCLKLEELIEKWFIDGFDVFIKAQKYIQKIDDRLSVKRQTFIQQIKSNLENETNNIILAIQKLISIKSEVDAQLFKKINDSAEKVISAIKFFVRIVDVVAVDPREKLYGDEKILTEATNMASNAYKATYGQIEEKLNAFLKQIPLSKNSKKIIDTIEEAKQNCLEPNNIKDIINAIPVLIDYKKNLDLLQKEIAVDLLDLQIKYIKKLKDINRYLGQVDAIKIPSENELVKIEEINFNDFTPIKQIEEILKKGVSEGAKNISLFVEKISSGLGVNINPDLESKLEIYRRPSFKPNIKQANIAINELEKFSKDLTKDTGEAINNYIKNLKDFPVKSEALKIYQNTLKAALKEILTGKLLLNQIITKLELAISEYSKYLNEIIMKHSKELQIILKDPNKINPFKGLKIETFEIKHNEFISNISLESVLHQKEEEKPILVCKICKGKIVWQQEDYNEMLGFNVLRVRCINNHEDNIIDMRTEIDKEIEVELKCTKCGSESLLPVKINLFTDEKLTITTTCPNNHETEFNIKK